MNEETEKGFRRNHTITTLFLFHIKRGGDDKVVRFMTKIIGRSNAPVSNFKKALLQK